MIKIAYNHHLKSWKGNNQTFHYILALFATLLLGLAITVSLYHLKSKELYLFVIYSLLAIYIIGYLFYLRLAEPKPIKFRQIKNDDFDDMDSLIQYYNQTVKKFIREKNEIEKEKESLFQRNLKKIDLLNKSLETLRHSNNELRFEKERVINKLSEENRIFKDELNDLKKKNIELRNRIVLRVRTLTDEIDTLHAELNETKNRNLELNTKLEEIKDISIRIKSEKQHLIEKVTRYNELTSRFEGEIKKINEALSNSDVKTNTILEPLTVVLNEFQRIIDVGEDPEITALKLISQLNEILKSHDIIYNTIDNKVRSFDLSSTENRFKHFDDFLKKTYRDNQQQDIDLHLPLLGFMTTMMNNAKASQIRGDVEAAKAYADSVETILDAIIHIMNRHDLSNKMKFLKKNY